MQEPSGLQIRNLAYDRNFFPAPRDKFLQCWLRPEQRKAIALIDKGEVRGYGVVRTCRNGYKVGPLLRTMRKEQTFSSGP